MFWKYPYIIQQTGNYNTQTLRRSCYLDLTPNSRNKCTGECVATRRED